MKMSGPTRRLVRNRGGGWLGPARLKHRVGSVRALATATLTACGFLALGLLSLALRHIMIAMRCGAWIGMAITMSIAGAGCVATEEWTQTLFAKHEVEVDQRFVKVEADVRDHEARIDRVEVQVNHLDTRLTETRDLVRTSLPQTPSVAMRPPFSERRPGRSTADRLRSVRTLVGIINVPFGFDRADLDAGAEAALGAILKELRDNPGLTIDLEGTTDSVGRRDYNIRLSQRRVETVVRWLVARGVDRSRIVGSTGRGPLGDDSVRESGKRRVMVKLMASAD